MYINQVIPTALPIFPSIKLQSFRLNNCMGLDTMGAIQMRKQRFLPWLIQRPTAAVPTGIFLVKKGDLESANVTSMFSGMTSFTDAESGLKYATYPGSSNINVNTSVNVTIDDALATMTYNEFVCSGDFFYFRFQFGADKHYSELLQIVDFPEFSDDPNSDLARIRIEAVNSCAIGEIPVTNFTPQKIFLNTLAEEPDYESEFKMKENGQKEERPLWAKVKKKYKIRAYCYESVCDFLNILPLFPVVNITDECGLQSPVYDIEAKTTWPDEGNKCLALVEITFAREFIPKTDCC